MSIPLYLRYALASTKHILLYSILLKLQDEEKKEQRKNIIFPIWFPKPTGKQLENKEKIRTALLKNKHQVNGFDSLTRNLLFFLQGG